MRIAGIVAEYNPFHNGHAWQIAETRRAGCTHIAAVMSGNFTQRGEPACMPWDVRVRAALACGADLVLELPLPWAVSPAESFARAAVGLLDAAGCIDVLSFGSESGDVAALRSRAMAIDSLPREQLLAELETGASFPRARAQALAKAGLGGAPLWTPNDTLGIEYLRALLRLRSPIEPMAVPRESSLHDAIKPSGDFASASYLRGLLAGTSPESALPYMPPGAAGICRRALSEGDAPFCTAAFESQMISYLRRLTQDDFARVPDIAEGLENRIFEAVRTAACFRDVLTAVKTKRYTLARLRRILLNACLGVDAEPQQASPPYLRVLGFNGRGAEILARMKRSARLPVVSRWADIARLGNEAQRVFALGSRSTDLYAFALPRPRSCGSEKTCAVVKMDS